LITRGIVVLVDIDCIKGLGDKKRFLYNVKIFRVGQSTITKGDRYDHGDDSGYESYEQALEVGLIEALKLIQYRKRIYTL
jgi:hypothetical protein